MINNLTFPDGITYEVSYVTGGDFLGRDFTFTGSMSYLYAVRKNSTIRILYDTSKVTNMSYMFNDCTNLTSISQLDTSNVTNMSYMFNECSYLTSIPQLDTSKVTDMSYMFYYCSYLTSIPQLDTSKVTSISRMFTNCNSLTSIPLLDCSSITNTGAPFGSGQLTKLTNLGGFKNLKVSWTSNFLDRVPNATVESLMNVINNLYDLTANGLSGKSLKFGSTNLNKLTAEQKAIATAKGWTLTT